MRPSLRARSRPVAGLAAAVLCLGVALGACGTGTGAAQKSDSTSSTVSSVTSSTGPTTTSVPSSTSTTTTTTTTTTTSTVPSTTTTTTTTVASDPVPQPTASHPLTIVEIGDSLGEDLGFGLGDLFEGDPYVRIVQAARGDTGLANTGYYDWQTGLASLLQQYHPGAVIVFLGANDGQNFWYGSQYAAFGNAVWHTGYSARVAALMSEATAAGARVLWVGMPIMQDPGFWQEMEEMNAIYAAQAALHPGVTYFSSAPVFENAAGQYMGAVTEPDGAVVLLRDSDGIHLASGGDTRLASALVTPMEEAWGIKLFPPGSAAG